MRNLKFGLAGIVVIALVVIMTLFGGFFTVSPGYRGIVTTNGSINDEIYTEGLHFKVPFVQSAHTVNVQQLTYEGKDVDAASKDLQTVTSSMAVNFAIDPLQVKEVYRNYRDVETLSVRALAPSIEDSMKYATAQFTAEELITKRAEVQQKILSRLREKLALHFVIVKDLSITNFAFSKSYSAAIEEKVTAEQKALTAQNNLKRIQIEGEQQVVRAKAEAETIRVQAEAITKQGGAEYVQLKAIEKWKGEVPSYVAGTGSVPFINLGK